MSKLKDYFIAERGRAADLSKRTLAAPSFLRAIAEGERPCPPKLAVSIEVETGGAVTRKDLFPKDWREIWPELAANDPAPAEQTADQGVAHG